jgi:AraC-like DNA-binding protein
LTRFEIARQFCALFGTSPYRSSLMRRLVATRGPPVTGRPLVDVALDAGFADQAHFTRMFTAAYGMTPARYARLGSAGNSSCSHRKHLVGRPWCSDTRPRRFGEILPS